MGVPVRAGYISTGMVGISDVDVDVGLGVFGGREGDADCDKLENDRTWPNDF